MARIKMDVIVEDLDENFGRVLKAVVDEFAPGNEAKPRDILRVFRTRLERGFENWEHVSDRAVNSGY